jgi:hypothetical protein
MRTSIDTTPRAQALAGLVDRGWSARSAAPLAHVVRGGVCPHVAEPAGFGAKVGSTGFGMQVDCEGIRRRPPAP